MRGTLRRRMVVMMLLGAVGGSAAVATAYWSVSRLFVPGDDHAFEGIVDSPVAEDLVFQNAAVWDGLGGPARARAAVLVRDGRIAAIGDREIPQPRGARVIDATGNTLIPGIIDAHVHLLFDSGPDLRAEAAVELTRFGEIEARLREHIGRGIDVVKIATTHGDLGFRDARPDLHGRVSMVVKEGRVVYRKGT